MKIETLKVPTNPEYDFFLDPGAQHGYVNPVTLNNKLIELSNAYIDVTKLLSNRLREKSDIRTKLEEVGQALEDMEMEVLEQNPPTTTADCKSSKTIYAYVRRTLDEMGKAPQFNQLLKDQRNLKQSLIQMETSIEIARSLLVAIETQGTNIQTHLSFVKNEARNSRHYV